MDDSRICDCCEGSFDSDEYASDAMNLVAYRNVFGQDCTAEVINYSNYTFGPSSPSHNRDHSKHSFNNSSTLWCEIIIEDTDQDKSSTTKSHDVEHNKEISPAQRVDLISRSNISMAVVGNIWQKVPCHCQ